MATRYLFRSQVVHVCGMGGMSSVGVVTIEKSCDTGEGCLVLDKYFDFRSRYHSVILIEFVGYLDENVLGENGGAACEVVSLAFPPRVDHLETII